MHKQYDITVKKKKRIVALKERKKETEKKTLKLQKNELGLLPLLPPFISLSLFYEQMGFDPNPKVMLI